jgi:hypothetical protein
MVIEEGIIKAINTQKFWSWWTQPWTQESRFAQEQKFTMEKISTLVSIVKAVHTQSTGNETNNPLDFWVCCYTSKELMLEIMWPYSPVKLQKIGRGSNGWVLHGGSWTPCNGQKLGEDQANSSYS